MSDRKKHNLNNRNKRLQSVFLLQNQSLEVYFLLSIPLLTLFVFGPNIIKYLAETNNSSSIAATLELTKSTSNATPLTGEIFTYTLQYSCVSTTDDCDGTVITDPLPTGVEFVSVAGTGHTTNEVYISGTHTVTFTFVDPLPAGSTGEVLILARFPNGSTANGTLTTNTATISATNATSVNSNSVNVTAVATDKPDVEKYLDAGAVPDGNTVYSLKFCNTGSGVIENGTLNATNFTIVDTLPPGSNFVYANRSGVYDLPSNTVTWTYGTIEPGDCEWFNVTVSFPSTSFSVGDIVINSVSYNYNPFGEPLNSISTSTSDILQNHMVSVGLNKTADKSGFYQGQNGYYEFDWWNNSTQPLAGFYLEDTIPSDFIVTDIGLGAHYINTVSGTVDLSVLYQTNLNSSWTTTAGSPYLLDYGSSGYQEDVSTFGLAVGERITVVRWSFGPDPMPIGTGSWYNIRLDFDVPLSSPAGVVTNCMTAGDNSGSISLNGSTCVDITVQNLMTGFRPSPDKYLDEGGSWVENSANYYNPGDTVEFILDVRNSSSASSDLVDPVIVDFLPLGLEYVDGSWVMDEQDVSGAPSPIFTKIENYKGTGRTFLKWEWTGASSVSIPQNSRIYIEFESRISEYATPGIASIANQYYFLNETSNSCSGGFKALDTLDFDEDALTTDEFCSDNLFLNINPSLALESNHLLIGQLDTNWTKYPAIGYTVPGGIANYKIGIKNLGNVPMTDLVIIDILPFVGDNGVIDLSSRDSRWRPNLVGPVSTPSGVTVYYSQEGNPCRSAEGIDPSGPVGCIAPSWSTTLPSDITTVQSLKFDFGSNILSPGDSIELEWPMRAPVDALTTIGAQPDSIAWNSFGFIATRTDNSTTILPTEPVKVGMAINELNPGVYGNFVWEDTNNDHIQSGGELGYDGIRIELFKDNGDAIPNPDVDTFQTFTLSANGGTYLFPNLPVGDYFAVFYYPNPFVPVTPNTGADDLVDSDGTASTYNGFKVATTPVVTILSTSFDYSWDLGIRADNLGAVGNYVWSDDNLDGQQNESADRGINGLLVNIYDNSSPSTIYANTTTANDPNGNPGYYLFDDLPPANYFVEFILPASTSFSLQGSTGSADPSDSDANVTTGRTEVFAVLANVYDDSWDAAIILSGTEVCGNGIDDDLDGLIDLDDTDCCSAQAPVLTK